MINHCICKTILSGNGVSASSSKGILKYLIKYFMMDTISNVLTTDIC